MGKPEAVWKFLLGQILRSRHTYAKKNFLYTVRQLMADVTSWKKIENFYVKAHQGAYFSTQKFKSSSLTWNCSVCSDGEPEESRGGGKNQFIVAQFIERGGGRKEDWVVGSFFFLFSSFLLTIPSLLSHAIPLGKWEKRGGGRERGHCWVAFPQAREGKRDWCRVVVGGGCIEVWMDKMNGDSQQPQRPRQQHRV